MSALSGILARRYLLGRKGRSLLILLGIALGVTMVLAVALTDSAVISSYERLLTGVAGRADLQVTPLSGRGFPADLLATVAATDGVAAAVPAVSSSSPVAFGGKTGNATFYGVNPATEQQVREYRLLAGHLPGAPGQVAVTSELASALGLVTGDRLQLLSVNGLTDVTVVGIFDARGSTRGALGPFGVIPLADAQTFFGKAGELDTIDVVVKPGYKPANVSDDLRARLAGRAGVGTPWERSRDLERVLDGLRFTLTMASSISLFAGAFIIYTNVAMGVAERRREISILRALGMRRRQVLAWILGEAALLGLLGAGIGLLWGYGLARAMTAQLVSQVFVIYGLHSASLSVGAGHVALALLVGVGAAVVAAFAPARETLAVSPVEALQQNGGAGTGERFGALRLAAGLALILVTALVLALTWPRRGMVSPALLRTWGVFLTLGLLGVVLLLPPLLPWLSRRLRPLQMALFGVSGRLAADNLARQPRRTAATASALLVGLTFMVGLGGVSVSQGQAMDVWWKHTINWDLLVSSSWVGLSAQVEVDPGLRDELSRLPGVKQVMSEKLTAVRLSDGDQAFLQAFDHRVLRQISELSLEQGNLAEAMDRMVAGGSVLISPAVAYRLDLKLGEVLRLPTPVGEQPFTVVGIMKDITPYRGTVQIDSQDYVRYWRDETLTGVAVIVADKGQVEAVRRSILDRWGEQRHLTVRSNHEFWQETRGALDSFYRVTDALAWIAILVAGLALANTLFASILERRREFGLLRAVGARRGEVVRVVVGEALGTGLVGGAFGLVAGLVLMSLMIGAGEHITGITIGWAIPWGPVATAIGVAVLLTPLAGLLPAQRAARLDVVEALRYE